MDFNTLAVIFVFIVMLLISSGFNIFLKTTSKLDWAMTFLLSLGLSIVFVGILNFN